MLDEDEPRDLAGSGGDADHERRMRREIANSNERRRMQSINAGFQSLRTLLPHHEGEKLSKAAILQQTAEYIYQLEQEKTRLLSQNSQLKRLYSLSQQQAGTNNASNSSDDATSPRLKKKRLISTLDNTSDLLKSNDADNNAAVSDSVADISLQLLNEQRLRMRLEERLKSLETQAAASAASAAAAAASLLPTQPLKMEVVASESSKAILALAAADRVDLEKQEASSVSGKNNAAEELKNAATPRFIVTSGPVVLAAAAAPTAASVAASSAASVVAAEASNTRQNLDSIVEAIRHLEGDHLFSEDSHKVAKEEIVDFTSATPLSHHVVSVSKTLVPSSKKVVAATPSLVVTTTSSNAAPPPATTTPIPPTLLPKQPHPPSAAAVLQRHMNESSSKNIIIVKQCQT